MSRLSIAIVAAVLGIIAAGSLFFIYDSLSAPSVVVAPATLSLARPITVNITGEVTAPGTYELSSDARLADAIAAAGGLTENADLATFNPARRIVDAEQIEILAEVPPTQPPAPTAPPPTRAGADPASTASGAPTAISAAPAGAADLVNINTADAATLDTLPGIGPAIAQRVIDYRTEQGPFATVDELARVSGISAAMVDELRPLITIGE